MTEQSASAVEASHQGPGVYGGWETHRGHRHACAAPDCGPQGVRITPDPAENDAAIVHLPDFTHLDTQAWAMDVGVSCDVLRELRDAITTYLKGADR